MMASITIDSVYQARALVCFVGVGFLGGKKEKKGEGIKQHLAFNLREKKNKLLISAWLLKMSNMIAASLDYDMQWSDC